MARRTVRPEGPEKARPETEPPGVSADERKAFEEAMKGARPLARGPERIMASPPAGPPGERRLPRPSDDPPSQLLSHEDRGAEVVGWASGVSRGRLRDLRSGAIPPQATLDLHGATTAETPGRIRAFLSASSAAGHRCVLLVHGRGHHSGPAGLVLRDAVLDSFRKGPAQSAILAYTSAPPVWGGPGALLVLLRR